MRLKISVISFALILALSGCATSSDGSGSSMGEVALALVVGLATLADVAGSLDGGNTSSYNQYPMYNSYYRNSNYGSTPYGRTKIKHDRFGYVKSIETPYYRKRIHRNRDGSVKRIDMHKK